MAPDRSDDTTDTPGDDEASAVADEARAATEGTDSTRRRRLLGLLGTAGAAALAGCGGGGGGDGSSGTTTNGGGGGGGGTTAGGGGGTSGGTATPSGPTTSVTARALSNLPSGTCEQASPESERTLEEGRIESDTTLGSEADVVIASRGLTVTSGATLTVEAGTTVVFGRGTGLTVGGTLEAVGTCSDPIAFTGDGEDWIGVSVGGGTATLDHALVEGAGGDRRAAVTVQRDGTVDLTNSEVRDGPGDAVRVRVTGTLGSFSGNALGGTDGRAFIGSVAAATALDEATTYGAADGSPVVVETSTVESGDTVELGSIGVPYTVAPRGGGINVTGRFVIAPGTTLRFGPSSYVAVQGQGELVADAGGGDPIRLLGTQEVRGTWGGVRFRDAVSTANVLRNVVVAHAGDGDEGQGLALRGESRVTVADSEFRANEGYGVRFRQEATTDTFDGNSFVDNAGTIWTSAQTARHVGAGNEFDGNDDDRVHVYAGEFDGHVIPEGEDHTWANPGVPYLLERARGGAFAVYGSLRLAPGITLQMASDHGVYVTGELISTVELEDVPDEYEFADPPEAFVTFEGAQGTAGYWKGIAFDDSPSTENSLLFTEISHAGGGRAPAATEQRAAAVQVLRGSALQLRAASIRQSAGLGVFVQRDNELEEIDFLYFEETTAPMYLYADSVDAVGTSFQLENNESDQIRVESPIEGINRDLTWPNAGTPYRVLPSQVGDTLSINAEVTVENNAELRFAQNVGVLVSREGQLLVDGYGDPVEDPNTVLRGVQATPGYWQGIRYSETTKADNRITHAGIYHTGSAAWPDLAETEATRAAVAATGAAEATVENCHIAEFEGVAFVEAFTSNPNSEDAVNATINTSGNVVK